VGFQGLRRVSDCGAIGDIYLKHKFKPNAQEGVAAALKAGTDLNCGVEYANLLSAARAGLIGQTDIDRSLRRLLEIRFRLGMFDPPSMVKYAQIPYSENDSPAHHQLALDTARKSIVLLKNEGRTLPLSKTLTTIAVIGPNANDATVLLGNYNGIPSSPVTPLEGIRRKLGSATKVVYARGSDIAPNMPAFEVIPSSCLFTTNGPDKQSGLKGEYFASSNFDGKAHRPAELTYPNSGRLVGDIPASPAPVFTRTDSVIDFDWWDGSPRADLNDDSFGVRWTGYVSAPASGAYQLGAIGMNAFELYLDGKQIVQSNSIHGFNYQYATVTLEAGRLYPIRLDYHEYVNDAAIQLVWSPPAVDGEAEALAAARQADAVIMVLGLSPRLEGEEMQVPVEGFEGGDRVRLEIPRVQEVLLRKISELRKPVVLVLMNGSAVAVNWARDNVPAIIEAWYPGQEGGTAIADVLFGDYNPGGRLPVTFYRSADQLPPFVNYSMEGRTYRFFKGEPLFPFGYGLSYTTFAYAKLNFSKPLRAGDAVNLSVEVTNTGKMAGDEVTQLYLVNSQSTGTQLIRSLAGFKRVALRPGERKIVEFTIKPDQLRRIGPSAAFKLFVGGKQPGFSGLLDAKTTGMTQGILRFSAP
jgi:beta-glucosidase